MDRLRNYLLLLVTAFAVMVGAGGSAAASASGAARVGAVHAPSAPLVLRAGAEKAAHVAKGEGSDELVDGTAPPAFFAVPESSSVAVVDALPSFDPCFVAAPHVLALPRGPPAFVS